MNDDLWCCQHRRHDRGENAALRLLLLRIEAGPKALPTYIPARPFYLPEWRTVAEDPEFGFLVEESVDSSRKGDFFWQRRPTIHKRLVFKRSDGRLLEQSCVSLERSGNIRRGCIEAEYLQAFCLTFGLLHLQGKDVVYPTHICMIGGGVGCWPMAIRSTCTEARLEVVEVSEAITEVALQHFDLAMDTQLSWYVKDGLEFIAATAKGVYDAICIDVCESRAAEEEEEGGADVLVAPTKNFLDPTWLRTALIPALNQTYGVVAYNVVGGRHALGRVNALFSSEFTSHAIFATSDVNVVFFGFIGVVQTSAERLLNAMRSFGESAGRLCAIAPAAIDLVARTASLVERGHLMGWLSPLQFAVHLDREE